jgi:hypothetical protein
MAGRVFSGEKSGPGFLASLAPVLFIAGLGISQVILSVNGKSEPGVTNVAGVMLATVLGGAGLLLTACVWGEVQAWIERTR